MREPRVGRGTPRSRRRSPARRASPTPKASNSTADDRLGGTARRRGPSTPREALERRVRRRAGRASAARARSSVPGDHQQALAHVLEAVGEQPRVEVGRLVVRRREPEVRLAPDRREQDRDLGQAPIERRRLARPADAPRPGSRTAPGRSGRGAGARRRGRAAPARGSRGPAASWRSRRRSVAASIGGVIARHAYETGSTVANVGAARKPCDATRHEPQEDADVPPPDARPGLADRRPAPRRLRRRHGSATAAARAHRCRRQPRPAASTDAGAGGAACAPSTAAGTVRPSMSGLRLRPGRRSRPRSATSSPGPTTTRSPHTATLKDDPACTTETSRPARPGPRRSAPPARTPSTARSTPNMTGRSRSRS